MVVTPWGALADVGYTWESWGGVWGGQKDPVHFEYPGFVVPAVDPVPEGLPWWAEIAMPTKAVDILGTKEAKSTRTQFHGVWCRWFPNRPECR
jgi:hypothetical protein